MNKPRSFYGDYPYLALGAAAVFALMLITMALLFRALRMRKKMETTLRRDETMYRNLVENISEVVYAADMKGVVTYISPNIESTTGYTRSEIEGKNFTEFILREDLPTRGRRFQKMLVEGDEPIEYRVLTRSGDVIWMSTTTRPMLKDGFVVGYQGVLTDITERKRMEESLRKSEERHRLLAENINDVIWAMDLDMNYTYISPAMEKLQGWRPDELETVKLEDIIPPESLETAAGMLNEQLEIGRETGVYNQSLMFDMELFHKSGARIQTEVTASFLFDEEGRPNEILGVTRDVSDRIKARKEKEELQEKLARSRKMEALGLLAGGVAHDLNNVLSGIVSYPDLLLMDLPDDSPMRKPIDTIQESGQKAADIVQDLLTLARRGVTTKEILNLNEIILYYLKSPEHRKLVSFHPDVRVRTSLDASIMDIKGSFVHLRKTVMNLVTNAAEAQASGGDILISTNNQYVDAPIRGYDDIREGDFVVLEIADKGAGIEPEDLGRIFEPFYTKKVMGRSGTGLGMAVVWGTIQDHHGYINVESGKDKGTTFRLYFPVTRERPPRVGDSIPMEEYTGAGQTILVIDDVKEQREIAASMLTKLNYSVAAASGGMKAIEYMKNNSADLLLLDMIMDPGIDGLETFKRIIEIHPGQKAIIASGFSETKRVKAAQALGAGAYLKKPYMLEKLGLMVKAELTRSRKETGEKDA
ncbi:MAG: PAS domain S-box protein [Desulfobacterales bacterium]|nr:PAS domain S-box protein [Desulfobacterales bacterium]